MDEFTKLISKIDFNKFFDLQLTHYECIVEKSRKDGNYNFNELIAAKDIFKDNIFQWFIKMINQKQVQIDTDKVHRSWCANVKNTSKPCNCGVQI